MFEGWGEFFLLIGSAGGALIGLLFVVVTLTAGVERSTALRGASLYMTPTLFQFGAVLVLSAVALAPGLPPRTTAALMLIGGLVGFIYGLVTFFGHRGYAPTNYTPHWSDIWWYGAAPAAAHLLLALAAGCAWTACAPCTPYAVGVTLTAVLLIGVRNAWDLVTWMAPRSDSRREDSPPS